jgi:hypothetical protein
MAASRKKYFVAILARNFLRFYHYHCAEVDGVIELASLPIRHPDASV